MIPSIIGVLGRSTVLYLGVILLSISIVLLGLITYIEDNVTMVIFAVFCRMLEGFFKCCIQITSVSILMIINSNEKIKYSAMFETFVSLGSILGPVIGSVLYYLVGYFLMFLIVGIMVLAFLIPMMLTMPSNINDNDESVISEDLDNDSTYQIESNISYYKLLSDPFILLLSLTQIILVCASCYFEPDLTFRLDDFTGSVILQGLIYS